MSVGIFRVVLPGGAARLATGDPEEGPRDLVASTVSLDDAIAEGTLDELPTEGPIPAGTHLGAPIASQEVWAAGVTYLRSRDARIEEALEPTPYDRVYEAERPELFFKSPGWRVRGPGEPIAVRADSPWNVPEPELAVVLDRMLRPIAYSIGNDVSSRSIEGENPLYLPQAKLYDGSCSLGPCLVPAAVASAAFDIRLQVLRGDGVAFEGATSTARMRRTVEDLAAWLGRGMAFPQGVVLLTGTGIVPDPPFTLLPGDVVRISIEGLGTLENPVESVGASAASPGEAPTRPSTG